MKRAQSSVTKCRTRPGCPVRQDFIEIGPPLAECSVQRYSATAPTRVPEPAGVPYFEAGPSSLGCCTEDAVAVGSVGNGVVLVAGFVSQPCCGVHWRTCGCAGSIAGARNVPTNFSAAWTSGYPWQAGTPFAIREYGAVHPSGTVNSGGIGSRRAAKRAAIAGFVWSMSTV